MRTPERSALLRVVWIVALLLAVPSAVLAHPDPLAPYRWVNPPTEVAAGNVAPLARTAEVPSQRDHLAATEVWTGDLQAVLSLPDMKLPTSDRATVTVSLSPTDAATLGRLPSPLSADGNAYAVTVIDGDAPAELATPGRVTLAVPHAATAVLYSSDGAAWTVVASTSTSPNQVEATFDRSGYYLAAIDHPLTGGARSGGGVSRPLVATLVALPVLALLGLVLLARRSTRQRASSTL